MPCDGTKPDPQITDTCISIHPGPGDNYWESPDINLNGFSDTANSNPQGADNTVDVQIHRAADPCPIDPNALIVVDVFISMGGLNLSPVNALAIGTKLVPLNQLPPNSSMWLSQVRPSQLINWTLTQSNPYAVNGPGHRCLIARCYPEGQNPQPDCFHVPGDQHLAQRNIQIALVSHRAPRLRVRIRTRNNREDQPEFATLRVTPDLKPSERALQILSPGLEKTQGFQRVSDVTPIDFGFELPHLQHEKGEDDVRVKLEQGQAISFKFTADLSNSKRGDAHIFRLTHARPDRRVIGGLTLVAVVV